MRTIFTIVLGILFGTILISSGAFSWSTIYDMFHFRSFHMFGLLFSAIGTAAISLMIIKKYNLRSVYGEPIQIKPKKLQPARNAVGGLLFGLGWGVTGSCSAPVFILLGLHWEAGLALFGGAIIGVIFFAIADLYLFKSK